MPRRLARLLALASVTAALGATLIACGGGSKSTSTPGVNELGGASRATDTTPSQVTATLRMGSGSAAVGQEATVQLQALGAGQPGLGAWTLNIAYDKKIVSVSSCDAQPPPSVCNPDYPRREDRPVRIAGASGAGVRGDVDLATIVFKCVAAGSSALHIDAEVFADATIGGPLHIRPTIEDGTITCS